MQPQQNLLTDITPAEKEASDGRRIAGGIIDFVLQMGLIVLFYKLMPDRMQDYLLAHKEVTTYAVVFVLLMLYRILAVLAFQRTLGMLICGTKFLKTDLQPLSAGEKLMAAFAGRTKKIRICRA